MFFGRYDFVLDTKGRLNFPARFRSQMGESFVVMEWVDNCLFAMPLSEAEALAERISGGEIMRNWEESEMLFSTAAEVEPDAQGRILLTASQREYAGLTKKVTVIGNRRHVEIWDTDVWEARMRSGSKAELKKTLIEQHI